ncbi:MAG: F0F1 ATP synthase subunit delta [Staphylococcus epidermidis]|nr:F0F1 ATP synthase subunit delta [Staphylococcus epidermidis]
MAKVAKKYAKALFDVALDTNQLDVVYEDLETISHSSFDFIKQLKAIDSNPSLNPYVVNTLKVLADNRHISIVENVFKSFQNLYNKYYKQDFAIIESTYELSEDEISRIVELIKKQTELSNVIVNTKINQDLIGGFRVKVGTTVMDGSVRNDLVQLQRKFERAN